MHEWRHLGVSSSTMGQKWDAGWWRGPRRRKKAWRASFQLEQRGMDLILVGQPPPERWAPLFQQQFWSVSCVALGFDYFRNI